MSKITLSDSEKQVIDEIELKCGEYLDLIPRQHWRYVLTPVLIRQLAKAREEIEYLKKRLENVYRDQAKHPRMAPDAEKQDRSQ